MKDNVPPQSKPRWKKTKIVLATMVGLLCLYTVLSLFFETGSVNYALHKDELHQIVQQAKDVSMVPGLIYYMSFKNGKLKITQDGEVKIHCERETGRIFVTIKRDNGFGSQGYIHAFDPAVTSINAKGFTISETRDYTKVAPQWWSYQSTKP